MIHVAGGTYLENCREPHWFELFGSGLRAALALSRLETQAKLSTLVGANQHAVLLAKAEGIETIPRGIPGTIAFEYLHPLSKPVTAPDAVVRELTRHPVELSVSDERVIRFGLIEGAAKVKAKMAVYDPQSPGDAKPFAENGSVAERLAIVANRAEAHRLSGETDPHAACLVLCAQGAEVAIVKCGAYGCWVGHKGKATRVPAFRSRRVFPVGSGDVFTALFARGWMDLGLAPIDAATLASRGTAYYVETRTFPDTDALDDAARQEIEPLEPAKHKRVYLAAPFFNLPQRWLVEEFHFSLRQEGVSLFSPVHDVGRGSADNVYEPDINGLKKCGVVLACLDGLDPGTIYEVGYAHSLGLPVIAFVSAERDEDLKMPVGGGCQKAEDFATALYLTVWAATCA